MKWTEDYQPFGVQRTNQDSDNTTGFTGHQHDDALELTYMQARWYHPEVGRFMALDPIVFRASDLSSFGRYTYAANNPYYYVDPDGRENMAKFDQNVFFNWKGAEGVKLYNSQMRHFDPETVKSFLPGMGLKDGIESFNSGDYLIGAAMIASEVPVLKWLKGLKVVKKTGLPKPPTGRGAVPKSDRDPKRLFTASERRAKRAEQGNQCANGCGTNIDQTNSAGHHIKRHADGGKTVSENHAEVCKNCHKKLHSKD